MKFKKLFLILWISSVFFACNDPLTDNSVTPQICKITTEESDDTKIKYAYNNGDQLVKMIIVDNNEGTHISRQFLYDGNLLRKVEFFSDSLSTNKTLSIEYSYPTQHLVKMLRVPSTVTDFNPVYVTTLTLDEELRVVLQKDSTSFPSINGPIYFKSFTKFQYNANGNLERVFRIFNPVGNLEEAFQQAGALKEEYTGYDDADNIYSSTYERQIQLDVMNFSKNNPLGVKLFGGTGDLQGQVTYDYLYSENGLVKQRNTISLNPSSHMAEPVQEFFNFTCK
jgi:hypothetical protein